MFARTVFEDASADTTFDLPWPFIDKSHVKATKDGAALNITAGTFVTNPDTGITTVTLAAQTGDLEFYRETPIPATEVQPKADTQAKNYDTSLIVGGVAGRALLYILQEAQDLRELLTDRVADLEDA